MFGFIGVDVNVTSDEDFETSLRDISLSLEYISPTGYIMLDK